MKHLKITLSVATLFIASHTVQATELQEQKAPTNEQALYQLELQPIYQPELISVFNRCNDFPDCGAIISSSNLINQPLEAQPESTPAQ